MKEEICFTGEIPASNTDHPIPLQGTHPRDLDSETHRFFSFMSERCITLELSSWASLQGKSTPTVKIVHSGQKCFQRKKAWDTKVLFALALSALLRERARVIPAQLSSLSGVRGCTEIPSDTPVAC